jgi:hypothetical protein
MKIDSSLTETVIYLYATGGNAVWLSSLHPGIAQESNSNDVVFSALLPRMETKPHFENFY